jgi:hypothetical protein
MTQSKLQRTILAAGAVAALAAPVAVAAPGKRAPKQRAEYRNPTVSYVVRGQVDGVEVAAKTVAVTVAKSNRHGRALAGKQLTLDLSAARLVVRDTNGDGSRDLNDVAALDSAKAHVRLPKRLSPEAVQALADGTQTVKAKHVKVVRPQPAVDESGGTPQA